MAGIRQPIVSVVGHVDHGKTSILDQFRGSSVQEAEAGGITQKISFTRYPMEQARKACPLIEKEGIKLEIPGFLFVDTPGHAAFTNLRKRGGALADLAILVVSAKEGIKPQTAEVLQILKANKTPFMIAFNKIDTISGWQRFDSVKEGVEGQAMNVKQEFEQALLTFQGALQEHGFDSGLFYEVKDFTKKIALVPCSAKTGEGISELLFMLCGLSQRFLKETLKISEKAKGVVLEIKKEKGMEAIESILYDGELKEGDEVVIASFGEPIVSKVRAMEEILPLSSKYESVKSATAATGLRLHLTKKEGILPGMPFQELDDLEKIKKEFKKEISGAVEMDKQGVIIKAESLGSLEALVTLLKRENIQIVKSGIGQINKADVISAKANLEINPLDAVVVGFNVGLEDEVEPGKIKVISGDVVYKIIEDLAEWRKTRQEEIEREKLLGLATICKLEILHKYVFRNSNPAVFGVRVLAGKLKSRINLMDENGDEIAKVKSLQLEKETVEEAKEGQELAVSLPGVNFERKLGDKEYLYSIISEKQFRDFKKNKELLSAEELKVLQEIADIKRKGNDMWGM
jgi:translation initiation factor 5B